MRKHRDVDKYRAIKVIDPYSIAIILALRDGDKNITRVNLSATKYAEMTIATTIKKLKELSKYGIVEWREVSIGTGIKEKIYKLTDRGKTLADALAKVLGVNTEI